MSEETEKTARADYGIDKRTFVRLWESSNSVDECVGKLAEEALARGVSPMPKAAAIARASDYRAAGVSLKKHRPGRKSIQGEVQELNEYIAQLREAKGRTPSPPSKPPSIPPEVAQELARQLLEELRGSRDGDSSSTGQH